ncbi:MAG TPA: proton-conducting membrane transporter [Propionibacteriaceae bacterium]|nr:proton-conducting membrane transporter [Propionibacteriaceae bacterium]
MQGWDWYGDHSVVLIDIPLACCALEVEAAIPADAGQVPWDTPAAHRVVTVSGTVTNAVALDVADAVARVRALGGPTTVVAFGACTGGGGPYWDGYAVLKGLDQVTAVDALLPGCPPTPAALTTFMDEVRRG